MRIYYPIMRNIALCMELSDFYEHGIARGVVRYAKSRPDWRLFGYGWMFRSLASLEGWKGDGIVARIESAAEADRLASLGLPLVDVAGAYLRPGFRTVANDDRLTGRRAALHLRSCGFSRFAFLGVEGTLWSQERKRGFVEALEEGAGPIGRLPSFERSLGWWESGREAGGEAGARPGGLAAFLAGLEKPAALFACNDTTGLRATELAGRLGIAVPGALAILGVDDEDILCELASPSLSSIRLDCEAIGYEAARALDALIEGPGAGAPGPGPAEARRAVPPKEVAERESTRVYACPDELVARAATFIRARAHEGIGVPEVLAAVPASRRSLETRFRRALGRSLHEEIVRARLATARRLLAEGGLSLDEVASRSGFGALQRFHSAFKEAEGISPGQWRKRRGRG